jgi:hypothetical protein
MTKKPDPSIAKRAIEEAIARQTAQTALRQEQQQEPQREIGGRNGPDPARFGDWENKGIAYDF